MVRMRYGSALGTFGEHRRSPNAPKCIPMHLGAFRERLCSPNVPNATTIAHTDHNMVRMRYGSALGTFGEHRRSPNAPKCIGMHLGAYHSVIRTSKYTQCAMVAHWDHYGEYALW